MLTELFDFLTYSTLGASLVASMAITPDAAFELITDRDQIFIQETSSSTLTLKSNTPIKNLTGTIVYDPDKLTITAIEANNSTFLIETKTIASDQIALSISTDASNDTIGVHDVLNINFYAHAPGEHTVKIHGLTARTAAAAAVYSVPELSTNVTALARTTPLDLNADADYTLSDLSLFALHFMQQDAAADFNNDERVDTDDLQLLLKMF